MAEKEHGTLKVTNSWESLTHHIQLEKGTKELKKIRKVSIQGNWYPVEGRVVNVPYNDMGHTYTGSSIHYFIKEDVFGVEHEFDLYDLLNMGVDITVVDYKVNK